MYRCEAVSIEGFIQQLAVSYVAHGYWFYVTGWIPEHKDPCKTDEKILRQYRIDISKWVRVRRKRAGLANVQYLRHGRFFVIVATHGAHRFFTEEAHRVLDLRRVPLVAFGYAVSYRAGRVGGKGHASVRIERRRYRNLKAYFEEIAVCRSAADIAAQLRALPAEPYAPVRRQLLNLLRAVNRKRHAAGLEPVPFQVLRLRRRPIAPFAACV